MTTYRFIRVSGRLENPDSVFARIEKAFRVALGRRLQTLSERLLDPCSERLAPVPLADLKVKK